MTIAWDGWDMWSAYKITLRKRMSKSYALTPESFPLDWKLFVLLEKSHIEA